MQAHYTLTGLAGKPVPMRPERLSELGSQLLRQPHLVRLLDLAEIGIRGAIDGGIIYQQGIVLAGADLRGRRAVDQGAGLLPRRQR
jgi:hypothetical protein